MKARKYDLENDEKEIGRWFEEMTGYLKTDDFVNRGTDREGRKFALEAFEQMFKVYKEVQKELE